MFIICSKYWNKVLITGALLRNFAWHNNIWISIRVSIIFVSFSRHLFTTRSDQICINRHVTKGRWTKRATHTNYLIGNSLAYLIDPKSFYCYRKVGMIMKFSIIMTIFEFYDVLMPVFKKALAIILILFKTNL